MRRSILILGMVAVLAVFGIAAPSVKVLIIDQTQNLMESMQVGILARILRTSGDLEVEITGTTEIPEGPLPQGPFRLAIIVPAQAKWVWVCTPAFPEDLSPEVQMVLGILDKAVEQVFRGERRALDPADDLYVLGWSAYFLKIGVLG